MTKNKVLSVSVLSAVLGVSVVALAHPGGPKHFEKLDTNADGVVTTAEFEAGALAHFTKADANQDGKVTTEEAKALFAQHKDEHFAKKDTNGNGQLERSEVAKMPEAMFAKIDADKSGSLSESELTSAHPHGDAKGKGPGRFGHKHGLPGDVDGDGTVTKAEAVSGAQQLAKKLDADADGKLTKEELTRGHGRFGRGAHGPRGAEAPAQAK